MDERSASLLVHEAHERLFSAVSDWAMRVRFSGRFKPHNAAARWQSRERSVTFSLSRSWEGVNPEILIGLFQELLLKVHRVRGKSTSNIALYHHYLQSVHLSEPPQEDADPYLLESFERVNARYFSGTLIRPRMQFGSASVRTLGHYHYGTDTVTLSLLLREKPEMLDYVMYHELLHKSLKYHRCGSRSQYHTPEFRRLEREFENSEELERRLRRLGSY